MDYFILYYFLRH